MEKERIILGIDPGTTIMGYGVVRIVGKKMEMIQMGVIHLEKLNGHALKLKRIFERTVQLVEEYKPDEDMVDGLYTSEELTHYWASTENNHDKVINTINIYERKIVAYCWNFMW